MADKFDPYREALVVETDTVWPEGLPQLMVKSGDGWPNACMPMPNGQPNCNMYECPRASPRITATARDLERLKSA